MDNLTHTLTGWTLARAGAGRGTPLALPTLLVASNAPDIDIVALLTGGAVDYLAAHRGATHGPLGLVSLAAGSVALVALAAYARGALARRRYGCPRLGAADWARLLLLAVAAVALHVLMDLPTSYGTRLLSPFVWTWYAFDWMPIIDIYLLAVLAGALLIGWRRPGLRVHAARLALALLVLDYAGRAWLQSRALEAAARYTAAGRVEPCASAPILTRHPSVLEAPGAGPGACVRAAALPTFVSPFTFRAIRQYADGYELSERPALAAGAPVPGVRIPSEAGSIVARARTSRPARVFLDFARMPATDVGIDDDGRWIVRMADVRFVGNPLGLEPDPEGRAPFLVTVVLDGGGRVIAARLGD